MNFISLPAIQYVHDPGSKTIYMILCETVLSSIELSEVMEKVRTQKIQPIHVADTLVDGIRTDRFVINLDRDWKSRT